MGLWCSAKLNASLFSLPELQNLIPEKQKRIFHKLNTEQINNILLVRLLYTEKVLIYPRPKIYLYKL